MDIKEQVGVLLITALLVCLIAFGAEKVRTQADDLSIFRNPAQLQIRDTQDPKRFPFIVGIKCEILPCGQRTGRQRECVVACNVQRRGK